MNQTIKSIIKFLIVVLIITFTVILCFKSCSADNYKVKTEYGDVFYMSYDSGFKRNFASVTNLEHDFNVSIGYVDSEKDLTPVCDTEYFRCYRFKNELEDFYICGLKPDGNYLWIDIHEEAPRFFKEKYSEDFKKTFLSDKYIMEITLPYMDDIYHNEFVTMAEKIVSEDFEGLDKYGLTEEMIRDTKSLEEKTKILKNYFNL